MQYDLRGTTEQVLQRRNQLLADSDWLVIRHRDQIETGITPHLSPEQYGELLVYRKALRDWDKVSALPAPPQLP